jgi:hypothetical protein
MFRKHYTGASERDRSIEEELAANARIICDEEKIGEKERAEAAE